MKVLKKTEVVRLKQIEHVNSERAILQVLSHPFVVKLYVPLYFESVINLTKIQDIDRFKMTTACICY